MNERNAGRWLAVPAGGDSVTLLPMDGAGPNFFVKASDYDALRAEVAKAHADNLCDACAGTGETTHGGECMCAGSGKMSDAARYLRAEVERLRAQAIECGTHHPDYIIGIHWLAAAYGRICAGEDEKAVMADYGYAYISLPDRPLTVWEVIRAVELARERLTVRVRDTDPTDPSPASAPGNPPSPAPPPSAG